MKTFEKLHDWIQDFNQARGGEPMVLIGNKIDLIDQRLISYGQGNQFALNNNAL